METKYKFSDWKIGGVTHFGSITISSDPGWSSDDKKIDITNNLAPMGSEFITIKGSFNDEGKQASIRYIAQTFFQKARYGL